MRSNKAISPVVATALLLVITVLTTISFQNWFNTYSNFMFTDIENQINTKNQLSIEGIIENKLYIKSDFLDTLTTFKITNTKGNIMCEINNQNNRTNQLKSDTRLLLTFDNGTATDLSGYQNNGEIHGGVNCSVKGINGLGCEFNGINGQINVLDDDSLDIENSLTLSTWVKLKSLSPRPSLIGKSSTYAYFISNTKTIYSFLNANNGWEGSGHSLPQDIELNKWYNIIITYESNNKNIVKYYLDGKLIFNRSNIIKGDLTKTFSNVIIGNENGNYINGTLDEITIYSKALTDLEANQIFKSQKAQYYEQLLTNGIKEIDITKCNLEKGQIYDFIGTTNNQIIEETIIKK